MSKESNEKFNNLINQRSVLSDDDTYQTKQGKDLIVSSMMKIQSTSGKIRFLDLNGYSRSAIEKMLFEQGVRTNNGTPIRYQHVRNVLITPIKK